ncbi:hypothetical protein [Okeania sp.]|uniref:hypothetical protein n=1 Tax=Okeania sp. TaxID=3100323 RepID=UPI002B4B7730|nr:hypothetical protein [Okeania sp.]MEB3343089.1 hypothetical protein [Okeania sp.]
MSNLRWLVVSSSASGAGFLSIIFLFFTFFYKFTLAGFFVLVFVLAFFIVNVVFTAHYFSNISRELYIRKKMQTQMKMRAKPTRYR